MREKEKEVSMKVALVNPKTKKEKEKKKSRRRKPSFTFLAKINPRLPDMMKKVYENPTEYTVRITKKRVKRNPSVNVNRALTDKNTLVGAAVGFAASRFLVPRIAPNIPFINDNPQMWSFLTPAAGGIVYFMNKGKMKNIGLGIAVGGLADMLLRKFTGSTMSVAPPPGVSGLEDEPITEAIFPPPPDFYKPLTPDEEQEIQEIADELGISTDEELGFLRWLTRRLRRSPVRTAIQFGKMAPAWTPIGAGARIGERLTLGPSVPSAASKSKLSVFKKLRLRGIIDLRVV